MTTEVEQRPMLAMAGYGRHMYRRQWVNKKITNPGAFELTLDKFSQIYHERTSFEKFGDMIKKD